MHVSSQTAVLLAKEVQDHRDYFYRTVIKPVFEPSLKPSRKRERQAKAAAAKKGKNYVNGQDVEIKFSVSHDNHEDYLKLLDPVEWKDQDHYLVLGLGDRRYRANEEEIKKAHKRLILKHHPDKRRQKGTQIVDETKDYFACITKANEILGDPEKRRAYDSIDPVLVLVADEVPDKLDADEKHEFFETFGPVFRWNARWSSKQPVPIPGDENSTEEYVNEFYEFWYDFDSWRDYSYQDEAVTGEDRYERRGIEKHNKDIRKDKKSKEMARIRKLVDNAFASDPRISKFKDEEKLQREKERQAKKDAQRQREEAEEQQRREVLEKEQEEKRIQEEALKAEADRVKKVQDAEKKIMKRERKTLRDLLKGWNYFAENGGGPAKNMQEAEKLYEILSGQQLQELNQHLASSDLNTAKVEFLRQVSELNKRLEAEKLAVLQEKADKEKADAAQKQQEVDQNWSEDEMKLLIKAVNLYPAGTQNRWEVVAEYINHHVFLGALKKERRKKTAKDIITKSKSLKQIEKHHEALKTEFNQKAFDQFSNKQKPVLKPATDDNTISERFDDDTPEIAKPWTIDEQKLLEKSLKMFPASDPQRWENIAKELQTRTKDECVYRFKEIVAKLKAQKAAAAKTTG